MYVNRTGPYSAEIYLEKDPLPADYIEPKNIGKYGYVDIPAEARMDQTVQQLNEKLSTYKPTKEQQLASQGIAHPTHWYDYLTTAPIVIPAVGTAVATAPEWGPAAVTTVSNPAFWGELLKDTGTYIAADVTSRGLTGKGIGAHVNNAIGLEEEHPVGELLSFGVVNPTKNLIRKGINFTKKTLNYNPSQIVRTVYPNGKTRIRLNSHTDEMPREIVLDPQGNNKFYVHIRTWNDVNKKIPANLPKEDINKLYEAFYTELPEGAEVLVPESGPGNYATRGTIAGLKRLARDKRFSPGNKGKVLYDDNGKIKTYKTTSFIKRLPVDEEYINRQLIPLAQQQGNWQGHTPITSNVAERTTFLSDKRLPFAGLFNGSGYFLNTYVGPELTLPTYLHEIRHGLDYSIKYNSVSGVNPIRRFLRTNPLYMFKKGTYRPIQLTKDQIELLNQAYPTKFKIPLQKGRQLTEKISVNAEMRYLFDNLYYKVFGKKPTVEQLNYFINTLPDDIFVETLFGSRSGYMHTYMSNIVKPLSKAEGTFTIHTPPSPIDGTTTIEVNKNVLGSESVKRMKQAITSVPSVAGIGYGVYNTQHTQ